MQLSFISPFMRRGLTEHEFGHRRKAKGNTDMLTQGSFRAKQRRQEVGIKIFVPDYRTTKQKPKPTTTL